MTVAENIQRLGIKALKSRTSVSDEMHILAVESVVGGILPPGYRDFLLQSGGSCVGKYALAFQVNDEDGDVDVFYGNDKGRGSDLIEAKVSFGDRMPKNILPIADDGMGNQICIGVAGDEHGKVFFWDHDQEDSSDPWANMTVLASTFEEFLDSLVAE